MVEVAWHFAGLKYILHNHPVAKLNSGTLKEVILEALVTVDDFVGKTISSVCHKCKTNVVENWLNLANVILKVVNYDIFLVLDYSMSICLKNFGNNWITEQSKELQYIS